MKQRKYIYVLLEEKHEVTVDQVFVYYEALGATFSAKKRDNWVKKFPNRSYKTIEVDNG